MGNHVLTKFTEQEKLNKMDLEIFQFIPVVSAGTGYVAGEVLFQPTEIENVTMVDGGRAQIHSITAMDKDGDLFTCDLHFWSSDPNTSGANQEALALTAANAEGGNFLGKVPFIDWKTIGAIKYSQVTNCGISLVAGAGTRSVYVTGIVTSHSSASALNFSAATDLVFNISIVRN